MIETAQKTNFVRFSNSDPEYFYNLGLAIGKAIKQKEVPIATAMLKGSKSLINALIQGLQESKKSVIYVGEVSMDMYLFSIKKYNYKTGLFFVNNDSNDISEFALHLSYRDDSKIDLDVIPRSIKDYRDYIPTSIPVDYTDHLDISDEFSEFALRVVDTANIPELKVVIDTGNGIGVRSIAEVLRKIPQIKLIELHSEMSEVYPHHFPNPDVDINTVELTEKVIQDKADLGISVGVEGTRVRFIDHKGAEVEPQYLSSLLINKFLTDHPHRSIVTEPSYQRMMNEIITEKKGTEVICDFTQKSTSSAMIDSLSVFGFDNQDNYYYSTNHYNPSGIITILHLFDVIGRTKKNLVELIQPYKAKYPSSSRISLQLKHNINFEQIKERLISKYFDDHVNTNSLSANVEYPDWRVYMRKSLHDPEERKIRYYVEAKDGMLVSHIVKEVKEYLSDVTDYYDEELHTVDDDLVNLHPREQALKVYKNYYYSWNRHSHSPTHPLYNTNWIHNPSPISIIKNMSDEDFNEYWKNNKKWIHLHLRHLDLYTHEYTYYKKLESIHHKLGKLNANPIAYFSMEFAISDWLQIYSGGLGVLAGDVIKQFSDSGVPSVGVGIFYNQGYFHQKISDDGEQIEEYTEQKIEDYPFEPAKRPNGEIAEIEIQIVDHPVYVRAWIANVGRSRLILLDTNFDKNERWEDRMITAHLYGGDQDTRIRQEVLLGIGGYRMLIDMGIDSFICHMNEGHSAFVQLSMAKRFMYRDNINFQQALEKGRSQMVFTNHTLKTAGNDNFPYDLTRKYLEPYAWEMNIDFERIWAIGSDEPITQGKFSMTIAGMRGAKVSNAVSELHSKAAKKIWPSYSLTPVTNGVHMPTWVARPIHQLLDVHVGERWHDPRVNTDFDRIYSIPKETLWKTHKSLKKKLINELNTELDINLNTDAILFSWFRRFAEYKRPDIIISDVNRLLEIVSSESSSPIQFIIGGKAHPQDTRGQELLRKVFMELKRPEFKDKIVFVPGYNWRLAKLLVAGSDVWVNTPRRYEEASGTSGMKAAANGVLQLTTLDGWTDEVNWQDKGWTLADHDPNTFFNVIQNEIIPAYNSTGFGNFPKEWTDRMLRTMRAVLNQYSSERQVDEYIRDLYLPLLKN